MVKGHLKKSGGMIEGKGNFAGRRRIADYLGGD